MRKYIKRNVDKLRSKFSSSRSPSPAPPRISQNAGSQPLQQHPEPADEAASDPDITPNAQPEATSANIAPSPPIPPSARSEEASKDMSPSLVSAWDIAKSATISTLRVIKEASGALPPLQAAVCALIPIIEIIQVCRFLRIVLSAA